MAGIISAGPCRACSGTRFYIIHRKNRKGGPLRRCVNCHNKRHYKYLASKGGIYQYLKSVNPDKHRWRVLRRNNKVRRVDFSLTFEEYLDACNAACSQEGHVRYLRRIDTRIPYERQNVVGWCLTCSSTTPAQGQVLPTPPAVELPSAPTLG
jgi:hypothetical protein